MTIQCINSGGKALKSDRVKNVLRAEGFTLIELVIVISLVAILAGMLLSRALVYQELAEKAAMQQVVSALQSALVLQYGHRMALGLGPEVNNIVNENPMEWLARKPNNYAGELKKVRPGIIESGNWAFDVQSRELVYVPDHATYFAPAKDGLKWIRFRTRMIYENMPGNKNKGRKELTAVTFSPVEPYQWTIQEK